MLFLKKENCTNLYPTSLSSQLFSFFIIIIIIIIIIIYDDVVAVKWQNQF